MHKKLFSCIALASAFHAHEVFCQVNDLQGAIHGQVEHFALNDPKGKELDDAKQVFSSHTHEEVARALMAELYTDRGDYVQNHLRDGAIRKLYKAFELPPSFICNELEKAESPQRKASIMAVMYGLNSPEVTTALLDQLRDRRPAVDYHGEMESMAGPLRVCDVACNILSHNLEPNRPGYRVGYMSTFDRKDEVIQQTLKDLNLSFPKEQ